MSYLTNLVETFPIRKSAEEKKAFQTWALEEAERLGYKAKIERSGDKHENIVIGDPEKAQVTFTAHYDTPACMGMPNIMMPRNIPLFFAYQMLVVGIMLAVSFAAGAVANAFLHNVRLAFLAAYVVYFGLLMLLLYGPSNKHNVNDNTSGVSAVLETMALLPEDQRHKAAFILFDNEEKGLRGSKAYAKDHQEVQCTHLIVNMDCVGVGENILVIARKLAEQHPAYAAVEKALGAEEGRRVHFFGQAGSNCNSDQKSFQCGVAVVACKKAPAVGYYTPWLHTAKDTQADEGNIAFLARGMAKAVEYMQDAEA